MIYINYFNNKYVVIEFLDQLFGLTYLVSNITKNCCNIMHLKN